MKCSDFCFFPSLNLTKLSLRTDEICSRAVELHWVGFVVVQPRTSERTNKRPNDSQTDVYPEFCQHLRFPNYNTTPISCLRRQ
ncbi:hypothetical protein VTL71DRAFT_12825 [Oculimacula yallundae]|uniref:Uncharacterized protein n=1 Tax=Oculimacula yallundae TaxID=86028 RepID=A0ABR4CP33_9HELO